MSTTTIKYFAFAHLPAQLQAVSKPIGELANLFEKQMPDGPEKSAGMRKLLEAKDCFVRAALDAPKSADASQAQPATVTVKEMVDRFLGWPLPRTFSPDCGISFDGRKDDEWNKNKAWPSGTNLLNAEEARAMFEHVVQGAAPLVERPALGAAFPGYNDMQPHQQRMVDEKCQLDARRAKLMPFFDTPTFAGLDPAEQARLNTQALAMATYSHILTERIAAFTGTACAPA
jgi:hypothetical protein